MQFAVKPVAVNSVFVHILLERCITLCLSTPTVLSSLQIEAISLSKYYGFTIVLMLVTSKVKFLKPQYHASVINDRRIITGTIKANKRLLWANNIRYMQASCTI